MKMPAIYNRFAKMSNAELIRELREVANRVETHSDRCHSIHLVITTLEFRLPKGASR